MHASFESDHGNVTELDGVEIARSPLTRLGRSMYLFIVARGKDVRLIRHPSRPTEIGPRWCMTIEHDEPGRWTLLDSRDGGGNASSGPDGLEAFSFTLFDLPPAGARRLRLRYWYDDSEPVEELIDIQREG